MTRRVDDSWKRLQQTTFTNWVNNALRGHLRTAKHQVNDLQTDLQDGLVLAQLLETVATPRKLGRYNPEPNLKLQMIANLGTSFGFIGKEGIKLVNIGPEDIYNGELKLIMGLIWTLIQHYQIRSTGKAISTKSALLAWVNTQIPDQHISNFTSDWNSGVALCALVDRIRPGSCPNYAALDPSNKLSNCELGMKLAEERLGIHKVMEADDLIHPEIDEISVMTYISYFCKPANKLLLDWIQTKLPGRSITNLKTDWNDGINLSCLTNALCPGTIPNCTNLDPHDALENLVKAMHIAEENLSVKPLIKASQLADPNVDELNVATYLSRFQYARPVPQPQEVLCSGHGLYKAFVGRAALFEVDTSRGGVGDLKVTISANGTPVTANITPSSRQHGLFEVKYVPHASGRLNIEVMWSELVIPQSPFHVDVIDPAAFSFTGKQITGGQSARVGKTVTMDVKGLINIADLHVIIQHPDGHSEVAKIVPRGKGAAECSYIPVRVGNDEVFAKIAGEELPGTPYQVRVVDPSQCSITSKFPPTGKPLSLSKNAIFTVTASDDNLRGVVAEVKTPSGLQEVSVQPQKEGPHVGSFSPTDIGMHTIMVTCAGENVRGSPITLNVYDASKCTFLDAIPRHIQVGSPQELNISTKGVGAGDLEVSSSSSSTIGASVSRGSNDLCTLNLTPNVIGEATIDLKWNEESVPQTPFAVFVCDASKVSAYGPGLTSGRGKVGEPFDFTVQAALAGRGDLIVRPKGSKSVYAAEIKSNHNNTYSVAFTSYEVGMHTIDIRWGGMQISGSPYKVEMLQKADSSQFTATGDGLKEAIAMQATSCMLVGPESGLLKNNILKVSISGTGLQSTMVNASQFSPKAHQAVVSIADNNNGSYSVQYAVPTPGEYSLAVICDGKHIRSSPFSVTVYAAPNPSQCRAFGPTIDNPRALVMGRPLEFKVDCTQAGVGQLTVTATNPTAQGIPVFLSDDKPLNGEKIQTIKIDPDMRGIYKVNVEWAGKQIPSSPFSFHVSDPQKVKVFDLPEGAGYAVRVGEALVFRVDMQEAGSGELMVAAKLDTGKIDPFTQKPQPDGTVLLSYVAKEPGRLELLLTFCDVNLLSHSWSCDIANPAQFHVQIPHGFGKHKDFVKFAINGMTKKNMKNLQITANHRNHVATVKVDYNKDGTAIARFKASEIGEYRVEVKCARKQVDGSPFTILVANPDGCILTSQVPTVIPVGVAKQVGMDTSAAGPGELSFSAQSLSGEASDCLNCEFRVKATAPFAQLGTVKGMACGTSNLHLKWAGYDIPSMPVKVTVVDPSLCSFDCPRLSEGAVKLNEAVMLTIDTGHGGAGRPEVFAKGPKAEYSVALTQQENGHWKASFTPWQDGDHTLEILVGGAPINGSPAVFEVQKPLDPTRVTISGPGLKEAIANRRAEVTVYARESRLFEKGILAIDFHPTSSTALTDFEEPDIEFMDNGNGTYNLAFTPHAPGGIQLSLLGEGKPVSGSPYSIYVRPEPDATLCTVSGDFLDRPDVCQLINEPIELKIESTTAGAGLLDVTGSHPDGSSLRVFQMDDQAESKRLHFLKFDPTQIGIYTLAVLWDSCHVDGSPFKIPVVDPSKCIVQGDFPSCMQVGKFCEVAIKTLGAGPSTLEVRQRKPPGHPLVDALVEAETEDLYQVTFTAATLGEAEMAVGFGGHPIPKTPFTLSICDPTKCVLDISDLLSQNIQVGVPFHFTVATRGAGRAKLIVIPNGTEHHFSIDVQETTTDIWEVGCTAWSTGEQELCVMWGEEAPDSPITFTVCDPKKCVVSNLPDANNFTPIIGEPMTFAVDCSKAGSGELTTRAKYLEGVEELERETEDGITTVTWTPKQPGSVELVLKFSEVNILPKPWVCDVPDPTRFQVTPPKGYGKYKEYVKFPITGITENQRFELRALHPSHDATVKTEPGKDPATVIARFTAKQIGEYTVEVRHLGQHIDGSPFACLVSNPDTCHIESDLPTAAHIGVQQIISIDTSKAGPGTLTCQVEPLSGDCNPQPVVVETEDGRHQLTFLSDVIGQCRLTILWADYIIPGTPFEVSFVDAEKLSWACAELESGSVKQGEVVRVRILGKEAGQTTPAVSATGPESSYSVQVEDNGDDSFTAVLNPWQIGENIVGINWGGHAIPNTPIHFHVVKSFGVRSIVATGDGLRHVVVGESAKVRVTTPEAGMADKGTLNATFVKKQGDGDSESAVADILDNIDGTYSLVLLSDTEGEHALSILFEDRHILGSPFDIVVKPRPNASKCTSSGAEQSVFLVNNPIQFSVDSTDAGSGQLSVVASGPGGDPARVYSLEENAERKLHHLKLDPKKIGHYSVSVQWEGEHISHSPFDFNVIDPSRCKLSGLPLSAGTANVHEPIHFTVLSREAGDITPRVTISVGEEEEMCLDPTPITGSISGYQYLPDSLGFVTFTISLGGYDVPGSPFKVQVADPSQFGIVGVSGDYAIVCELFTFGIGGEGPGNKKLTVAAHGPSNDLKVDVADMGDGSFVASFVPVEPGSYEVFVECSGSHVSGSPFTVRVADPSKCQYLGDIPSVLQVGVAEEFVVKTRGAGEGDLTALLSGAAQHACVDCKIENQGLDSYAVTLTGKKIGECSVDLQWAGHTIPPSAFRVVVCDANQCKAYGQTLVSRRGKAGEPIVFTVVALHSGQGRLTVTPRGPSAQYSVDIKETKEATFEVRFTPWEVGEHKIDVTWGSAHIPKSPFLVNVDSPRGIICNATGQGLKQATAGQPATFTIISNEVGLLDKNALKVSVIGVQSQAQVVVRDNNNGSYNVQYTALTPGAYIASVIFYDQQITGGPFKINVVPGPDASKCRVYGPAFHPNTVRIAGTPLEFYVDTSEAGHGQLRVYIQGPNDYRPKVYLADDGKGKHSIKFDAMRAGKYFVVIAWSQNHVPGSPFQMKVHNAADASKVKAHGPGLRDHRLGEPGEFTVETKHAGIGTLLVRVHGLRDAFNIEAMPKPGSDKRTLVALYHPRIPGEYVIFVRWSGVHVPGSPFKVFIAGGAPGVEGRGGRVSEELELGAEAGSLALQKSAYTERQFASILESSFAQQEPAYDMPSKQPKGNRDAAQKKGKVEVRKKETKKESKKEKKHHTQDGASGRMARPPSSEGSSVGPVAPSMKMMANPTIGGLAQSFPPAFAPGYQQPAAARPTRHTPSPGPPRTSSNPRPSRRSPSPRAARPVPQQPSSHSPSTGASKMPQDKRRPVPQQPSSHSPSTGASKMPQGRSARPRSMEDSHYTQEAPHRSPTRTSPGPTPGIPPHGGIYSGDVPQLMAQRPASREAAKKRSPRRESPAGRRDVAPEASRRAPEPARPAPASRGAGRPSGKKADKKRTRL